MPIISSSAVRDLGPVSTTIIDSAVSWCSLAAAFIPLFIAVGDTCKFPHARHSRDDLPAVHCKGALHSEHGISDCESSIGSLDSSHSESTTVVRSLVLIRLVFLQLGQIGRAS